MLIVAFAMLSVPRLPPAPERLSTTKVSPKTLPNVVARGRAKMSEVVPAGTGAITWTVRVGHLPWLLWPSADDASKTAGVVRIARRSTSCVPSMLQAPLLGVMVPAFTAAKSQYWPPSLPC
jgi:hypothetical protein